MYVHDQQLLMREVLHDEPQTKDQLLPLIWLTLWTIKSKLYFNMSPGLYSLRRKTSYRQVLKLLDLMS